MMQVIITPNVGKLDFSIVSLGALIQAMEDSFLIGIPLN